MPEHLLVARATASALVLLVILNSAEIGLMYIAHVHACTMYMQFVKYRLLLNTCGIPLLVAGATDATSATE